MMMGYCDLLRVVERATSQTMSFTEKLAATNLLALKEAALRFRFVPCNLPNRAHCVMSLWLAK